MHWTAIYKWGFWPVLAVVALAAKRWGGAAERAAAGMFIAAAFAELIARTVEQAPWQHFDLIFAAIDVALCVGIVALTFIHGRIWLVFSSAFQMMAIIGHLTRLFYPSLSPLAYAILTGSSGYPSLISLAIGIMIGRSERS